MSTAKHYYGTDEQGFIRSVMFNDIVPEDSLTWVEAVEPVVESAAISSFLYKCEDGVATETAVPTDPPADYSEWDAELGNWVDGRDFAGHKQAKWEEIKLNRDAEEFGTFVWNNYTFDCDEVSQRRIQGAVQLAALDTNTVMDWTLADNTVQTFNATELQQIGQALGAHVNACHVKARGLRDQINAAETEAELSVISW